MSTIRPGSWFTWVRQTPDRAISAALQAAEAMEEILHDSAYTDVMNEITPSKVSQERVHWYLEAEGKRCARTIRIRLLEYRVSQALLGDQRRMEFEEDMRRVEATLRRSVQVVAPEQTSAPSSGSSPREATRTVGTRLAFEKTGLVPRSIPRTLDRVRKELFPSAEELVIQEFRMSRYQTLASMRFVLGVLCAPWLVSWAVRIWLVQPAATALWNGSPHELFLHRTQEERAFGEMQAFQEKIYFEVLVGEAPDPRPGAVQARLDAKAHDLAEAYNQNAIDSITNLVSDGVALGTLAVLLSLATPQIAVLKSFVDELVYSLSDATKAFVIILVTDVLVGFHSPHGWELVLELLLTHLGLPESKEFIFLFVATFPVILDTVFKYWIFRYLNQISPSAVATYHNMNE